MALAGEHAVLHADQHRPAGGHRPGAGSTGQHGPSRAVAVAALLLLPVPARLHRGLTVLRLDVQPRARAVQ